MRVSARSGVPQNASSGSAGAGRGDCVSERRSRRGVTPPAEAAIGGWRRDRGSSSVRAALAARCASAAQAVETSANIGKASGIARILRVGKSTRAHSPDSFARATMRRFTLAAKVGAFTVVMVVAGYLIYRFVSKTAGSEGGYTLFVRLSDASGIAKQSIVRIAGIGVGRVETIRLEGGRARIDMRIRNDVDVFEDAAVLKASASLLGEYYVAIAPGTEGRRKLHDGEEIKNVIEATTMDSILKDVSTLAERVNRVAEALANSIGTKQGEENMRRPCRTSPK